MRRRWKGALEGWPNAKVEAGVQKQKGHGKGAGKKHGQAKPNQTWDKTWGENEMKALGQKYRQKREQARV